MYERALAIYEKAYGPDHPDVAHTLTDLAVLHLEQVCKGWMTLCMFELMGWNLYKCERTGVKRQDSVMRDDF